MLTRCRVVVVGSLGGLFLVGGCGAGATEDGGNLDGSGNPDGGGKVGDGGSPVNSNAIGRPCDLLADAGQTQAVYNPAAAECPSRICLKPVRAETITKEIDTGPYCSATCSTDSDCDGEERDPNNPNDKRCIGGYACGVAFVVGPLCCKKLCLCKDFLGASLQTPLTCDPAHNQGLGCQAADSVVSAGEPVPNPLQETDFQILVGPERSVDILFMVDNSPSMDPKQAALAANFPKMIQQLQLLPGGLPDVHIGVISSDMGAGSDNIGGNCSRVLGDRGLLWGNDPTAGAIATVAGAPNNGCGLAVGARWIEDITSPSGVGRQQNYTGQLTDVFSCLAKAVGVNGCGYEHQLQSVAVALNPQAGINDANSGFLRPKAYLAIVLVTDEDDCSADPSDTTNNGMFLQRPAGETASMKCAARGHLCNNQPIPGYDPANGFTPQAPLPAPNVGFTHAFADCTDKEQLDRNHPDPVYLPLSDVRDMIDYVNWVKIRPQDQILVSGIIGWPPDTTLPGVTTSDQYQIGMDTTSLPVPQNTYWDYLPICTRPADKSADGNIYKAYGGLRLKKFIDGFGVNGQHFSICNSDFSPAMTQVGDAIVKVLKPGCVPYPLIDTQPIPAPGAPRGPLQPECQAMDKISCDTPGVGTCLTNGYIENPLPECKDPTSGLPFDPATVKPDTPPLTNVPDANRPCWYLYYDLNATTGCPDPEGYHGQRITALRPAGTQAPAGTLLALKCLTCTTIDPMCPPLHP